MSLEKKYLISDVVFKAEYNPNDWHMEISEIFKDTKNHLVPNLKNLTIRFGLWDTTNLTLNINIKAEHTPQDALFFGTYTDENIIKLRSCIGSIVPTTSYVIEKIKSQKDTKNLYGLKGIKESQDLIFLGKAKKISITKKAKQGFRKQRERGIIEFKILETYKNSADEHLKHNGEIVRVDVGWCHDGYEIDQEYIVFAEATGKADKPPFSSHRAVCQPMYISFPINDTEILRELSKRY